MRARSIAGVLSALAYIQVKKLGQLGEPEYRVVFYFSASGVIAGVLSGLASTFYQTGQPQILHALSTQEAMLLLAIGLTASVAPLPSRVSRTQSAIICRRFCSSSGRLSHASAATLLALAGTSGKSSPA